MSEKLVDAVIILEDAIKILRQDRANPDPEANFNTEESVIAAMLAKGIPSLEILRLKERYARAVRIIIRSNIDPPG